MGEWAVLDPTSPKQQFLRQSPKQRAYATSGSVATLLAAGKGFGKSIANLAAIDECLWDNPGKLGIIAVPGDRLLRYFLDSYFMPAFQNLIIRVHAKAQIIDLARDCKILYTTTGNLSALEGYTAAWAVVDEAQEMSSLAFPKLMARLRGGDEPRMHLACTPVYGWLEREFGARNDADRRVIHASLLENPHVTDAFIRAMRNSVPADLADAYIHGLFVTIGGPVYAGILNPAVHRSTWQYSSRTPYEIVCVIDWGFRRPHVLFAAILPAGEMGPFESAIIFDEIMPSEITTMDLCGIIKDTGYRVDYCIADPAGRASSSRSNMSDVEEAEDLLDVPFEFPEEHNRGIRTGIDRVKTCLNPFLGEPSIYFADKLWHETNRRGIIQAMRAYSFPQEKEGRPISDEPVKDGISDHACDCIRYLTITKLLREIPRGITFRTEA
jgi:hypothetical protein